MMRIWIDIDGLDAAQPVFGLPPLERHLRAIAKLSPAPEAVILSGAKPPARPVVTNLPLEYRRELGPAGQRLAQTVAEAGGDPVLALDVGNIVDPRLLTYMASGRDPLVAFGGTGAEQAAVLRLTAATAVPADAASLLGLAQMLTRSGAVPALAPEAFPSFIKTLRRSVPYYLQAVPDATVGRQLERRLFLANYKGSTDFLTKWVYPPLVWVLVRLCTRRRIHPNWITLLSIVLAFAAVPAFAAGWWWAGLGMGYLMSVLDSVDGKVARLTLTDSPIGNVLDHGLDIVHPPLWYAAWAWGLGARSPDDPLTIAMLWLFAFYVADRLVLMVAKARFKRGLHAMTAFDGAVRTWIARRNTNMVVFTLGLVAGLGEAAFYAVVAWQGLTMLWHLGRTCWLFPRSRWMHAG